MIDDRERQFVCLIVEGRFAPSPVPATSSASHRLTLAHLRPIVMQTERRRIAASGAA
jgi:hypothetical protein